MLRIEVDTASALTHTHKHTHTHTHTHTSLKKIMSIPTLVNLGLQESAMTFLQRNAITTIPRQALSLDLNPLRTRGTFWIDKYTRNTLLFKSLRIVSSIDRQSLNVNSHFRPETREDVLKQSSVSVGVTPNAELLKIF